jgi:hypothetical protein
MAKFRGKGPIKLFTCLTSSDGAQSTTIPVKSNTGGIRQPAGPVAPEM